MDLEFKLHPYQLKAYESKARIIYFIAGIQSGKTLLGSLWLTTRITACKEPNANFILASPNYKILSQSAAPAFMALNKNVGIYNSYRDCFEYFTGQKVWFRSMVDPNSCEGLSNIYGIWGDEIGMLSYLAFFNLIARSAYKQCPVMLTSTPYSLNFLYEAYKNRDESNESEFVCCKSSDNPYFPKGEIERNRRIMSPALFRMKFEGTFERPGGLVFADLNDSNFIEPYYLDPRLYNFYCGVDIGYNDPSVMAVIAQHYESKQIILCDEIYRAGLTVEDRINKMKELLSKYRIKKFFIDSAHTSEIESMKRAGLHVEGATKGTGSVNDGISQIVELIRTNRFLIFRKNCPFICDDLNTYSYKTQKKTEGLTDNIGHDGSHGPDAIRYCIHMIWSLIKIAEPKFKPQPTHLQRLLRGDFKVRDVHTEDW